MLCCATPSPNIAAEWLRRRGMGSTPCSAAQWTRCWQSWPPSVPSRRSSAERWGTLRVRMALHTGEVIPRAGDYHAPALNRAARLMAAGHGGQMLLSAATYELVRDHLPEEVAVRDLGQHRLK